VTDSLPNLRNDYPAIRKWTKDNRAPDRLIAHYVLERRLAHQLRSASAGERPAMYAKVYDELLSSLDDHPKKTNRRDPTDARIARQVHQIAPYLRTDVAFVELGCGDSALSLAVADRVRDVIGIDVQDHLVDLSNVPANYRFVRSTDGVTLPLATGSVDVVVSDQLLEHLHPEDALKQTCEVHRILKKGGVYICSTPNSLTGPHDISMFFDYTARGLHLKEYNYREIMALFKAANFQAIAFVANTKFGSIRVPIALGIRLEQVLQALSKQSLAPFGRTRVARQLFGINVIASK